MILMFVPLSLWSENIFFDLFGVLFHIPMKEKIKYVGVFDSLGYLFSDREDISQAKVNYLAMLSKIELDPERLAGVQFSRDTTVQGDRMPDIMIAWQAGTLSYSDALVLIRQHLEHQQYGYYEKRIFENANLLSFDLETRKLVYQPLPARVALLKRLAAETDENGRKRHRLFLVSNMDHEIMAHLIAIYPDIFNLFDGIVYSAQTKSLKPHPAIYQTLLQRYRLNPAESVMLDDQKENTDAAISLGIKGILYDDNNNVVRELESSKLLSPATSESSIAKGLGLFFELLKFGGTMPYLWPS